MNTKNKFFEKEVNPTKANIDFADKEAEHIRRTLGFEKMKITINEKETNVCLVSELLTKQTGQKPTIAFITRIRREKGDKMKVYASDKAICEDIIHMIEHL